MKQNYKVLMLGLMLVTAGQSLYSAAAGDSRTSEEAKQAFVDAASRGDSEAVLRFLDHGMDVNAATALGFTALMRAVEGGHSEIVKLLLNKGAKLDVLGDRGMTVFMAAVFLGHLEIVKLLLDKDPSVVHAVNDESRTVLMAAAYQGHLEIVKLLLDKGAKLDVVDMAGMTALIYSALEGHLGVVKLLLDKGASLDAVNNQGNKVLNELIFKRHREIIKLFLDKGARLDVVDADDETVLMYAVFRGDLEIVRLLLDHGAHVNFVNRYGDTALKLAVQQNYSRPSPDIVRLLLARGADSTSVTFSDRRLASIAAVFRALKDDINSAQILPKDQEILQAYKKFQEGNPDVLRSFLRPYLEPLLDESAVRFVFNQPKSFARLAKMIITKHPKVLLSDKDLAKKLQSIIDFLSPVFKLECIAQLIYYLITEEFADTREQAERFLGWS